MEWTAGDLRDVQIGTSKKRRNKHSYEVTYEERKIRAPYDRIICQLLLEDEHGEFNVSHEALRRQAYAREVLDEFAKELRAYKGSPADFRSRVLTPILQRQLMGVADAYFPVVYVAVADDEDDSEPTIGQATEFYLSEDPTDPALIDDYRHNIIFIPEARWHLGVVMGKIDRTSPASYKKIRDNHDLLMAQILKEMEDADDDDNAQTFSPSEVMVVVDERLDEFFRPELDEVVRITQPPCYAL